MFGMNHVPSSTLVVVGLSRRRLASSDGSSSRGAVLDDILRLNRDTEPTNPGRQKDLVAGNITVTVIVTASVRLRPLSWLKQLTHYPVPEHCPVYYKRPPPPSPEKCNTVAHDALDRFFFSVFSNARFFPSSFSRYRNIQISIESVSQVEK
jgi:hypothetical protein